MFQSLIHGLRTVPQNIKYFLFYSLDVFCRFILYTFIFFKKLMLNVEITNTKTPLTFIIILIETFFGNLSWLKV